MPRRRQKKNIQPRQGWAIYLRTSDKDAQNPKMSQARQRDTMQRNLLGNSEFPVVGEYVDNLSGRYADNRPGYQQMLSDARSGKFSYVAVENAERFGRNDTEALVAIDELDNLGIAVRFADYPDLNPMDADDRLLITISFTLARRESMKLGQRVSGGFRAKMQDGRYVGRTPDGYRYVEEKIDSGDRSRSGRYSRWIEPDPEQSKVWRLAWDLLLTDQYTLAEICKKLHERGYTYRSGRSFIRITKKGKQRANKNTLAKIFRNWTYAGWIVSPTNNIPPKTIRGVWKPIVSTEEFEHGLAILDKRLRGQTRRSKHVYLLSGLIYLQDTEKNRTERMICATPNPNRSGGGTSYYRTQSQDVHLLCSEIDAKVGRALRDIQLNENELQLVQTYYHEDIHDKLSYQNPNDEVVLEASLRSIDEEEKRTARLYAVGKITDAVWDSLWREWQDRRHTLRHSIESLKCRADVHIAHLDDAIHIISQLGVIYESMELSDQKCLLKNIVDRVVVDAQGNLVRLGLLPPFNYLRQVSEIVVETGISSESKKTSKTGFCSSSVSECGRTKT